MMNQPESVTVVIPAYRGAATISRTLESIAGQVGVPRPEVVVVDSSGDATGAILARDFPWVRVVLEPNRLSAGAARNRGVSESTGGIILFIDQDCIAPRDWIFTLLSVLRKPGIDGVGGSIGIANPTNLSGAAVYFLEFIRHFPRRGTLEFEPLFLLGCNAGYRAEVFRSVAFPDRTLGEDVLFSDLLRRAGFHLAYAPGLTVLHQNREGWREFIVYATKMGQAAADYHRELRRPWMEPIRRWPGLIFPASLAVSPWIACQLLKGPWKYLALFLVVLPACVVGNIVWAAAFYQRALMRRA
jgi:GT2 family glycosyltransferase